jgi:hypothetical protein
MSMERRQSSANDARAAAGPQSTKLLLLAGTQSGVGKVRLL